MDSADELLNEVVKRLVSRFRVKAVILFGSRARGDWLPWSDYDLLIIADFKEGYLDRIKNILEVINDIPLNIEPHPYTLEEAMSMMRRGIPSIIDALEEGRVIYSTSEFKKLAKMYEKLKRRGLKRTETSVIVPEDLD